MMVLENAERMHLERQVTLARVIFAALALVDLVEFRPPTGGGVGAFAIAGLDRAWASAAFLAAYLGVALLILGRRHPSIYDAAELGAGRRKLAWIALIIFVLCFSYAPIVAGGL